MENVLDGGTSDQDQIQLVSMFGAWVSPGNFVLWLGFEVGVSDAQVIVSAHLQ